MSKLKKYFEYKVFLTNWLCNFFLLAFYRIIQLCLCFKMWAVGGPQTVAFKSHKFGSVECGQVNIISTVMLLAPPQ